MPFCAAFGCTNRTKCRTETRSTSTTSSSNADSKTSFHRIPGKEPQRSAWLQALRRANYNPATDADARVCSSHFNASDFYYTKEGLRKIKRNAIPSVFPAFPKHLQKDVIHGPPNWTQSRLDFSGNFFIASPESAS
nr:PREDICTED: THAP domain-containing protein 6-like [Bemisia tabaci]